MGAVALNGSLTHGGGDEERDDVRRAGGGVGGVHRALDGTRGVRGVDMYRHYNPYTGEHFYAASTVERESLREIGWTYEGVG